MAFLLHPKLAADTFEISHLHLSRLLLVNDTRFPWLILVPERDGIREIHQLTAADRALLMDEITQVSQELSTLYHPEKLNVGALGNLVPQLHIHIVARNSGDAAWPGPVWGAGAGVPYDAEMLQATRELLAPRFRS